MPRDHPPRPGCHAQAKLGRARHRPLDHPHRPHQSHQPRDHPDHLADHHPALQGSEPGATSFEPRPIDLDLVLELDLPSSLDPRHPTLVPPPSQAGAHAHAQPNNLAWPPPRAGKAPLRPPGPIRPIGLMRPMRMGRMRPMGPMGPMRPRPPIPSSAASRLLCPHANPARRAAHPPRGRRRPAQCSFHSGSSRTAASWRRAAASSCGQPLSQAGPSARPIGGAVHRAPRSPRHTHHPGRHRCPSYQPPSRHRPPANAARPKPHRPHTSRATQGASAAARPASPSVPRPEPLGHPLPASS